MVGNDGDGIEIDQTADRLFAIELQGDRAIALFHGANGKCTGLEGFARIGFADRGDVAARQIAERVDTGALTGVTKRPSRMPRTPCSAPSTRQPG